LGFNGALSARTLCKYWGLKDNPTFTARTTAARGYAPEIICRYPQAKALANDQPILLKILSSARAVFYGLNGTHVA
jgi:hypothetical protein